MADLHPAVIMQLFLLPPPFHMSAAVLSLCLLTLPECCKSFLLGLYTDTKSQGMVAAFLYIPAQSTATTQPSLHVFQFITPCESDTDFTSVLS